MVQPLAKALVLAAILLSACASDTLDSADSTTSTPTDTAETRSGPAVSAPTTNPETATTVTEPEPTTTLTTTVTTTTEAPAAIVIDPDDLQVDPIFRPILDEIIEITNVPIRLPADLGLGTDDGEITATLIDLDENGYTIIVGFGPDCNGGNVCRIGTYSARRPDESDDGRLPVGTGVPAPLPGSLVGEFHDPTCGANCGDGVLSWSENDVRYSVGEKVGSGPAVLALAWLSIDPEVTPPAPPGWCGPEVVIDRGRQAQTIVTELEDGRTVHWLALCSTDGLIAELLAEDGTVEWIDFDSDGENDLLVEFADGATQLFGVGGNFHQAVTDVDTSARVRIDDLRCGDVDGDGRPELIDSTTRTAYDFINPVSVEAVPLDGDALRFTGCG